MKTLVTIWSIMLVFSLDLSTVVAEESIPSEALANKTHLQNINVQQMWDKGYSGKGVNIAILDSGIGTTLESFHEDFNPEYATKAIHRVSCTDDDLDECSMNDTVDDDLYHGTFVAGIITAQHNGKGIKGIAPESTLYSVKVTNKDGSNPQKVLKGLKWILKWNTEHEGSTNDIHIVNMSIGITSDLAADSFENEFFLQKEKVSRIYAMYKIKSLISEMQTEVLFVASAGNEGTNNPSLNIVRSEEFLCENNDNICLPSFPGSEPSVISVSSTTEDNVRSVFSSTGKGINLSAPGENVWSTIPKSLDLSDGEKDGYFNHSGTSFSTPLVTGYLSLLKNQFPDDTTTELKKKLFFNTVPRPGVSDVNIGDLEYGNGIMQAVPYGVKYKVKTKTNTTLYDIPEKEQQYKSSKIFQEKTELDVYLEWNDWLKVTEDGENFYWIKKNEMINGKNLSKDPHYMYVEKTDKLYYYPLETAENEADIQVENEILPVKQGLDEVSLVRPLVNEKVFKNYLWYELEINERFYWIKKEILQEFTPTKMQRHTQLIEGEDDIYSLPTFDSPSEKFIRVGSFYTTNYGYDYNEKEGLYNWYGEISKGQWKWVKKDYSIYHSSKKMNGFEDGIIESWDDYIESKEVQLLKDKGDFDLSEGIVNREEIALFSSVEYKEIMSIYSTDYQYRYFVHTSNEEEKIRMVFSHSPLIKDTSNKQIKTADGSQFSFVQARKSGTKSYGVGTTTTIPFDTIGEIYSIQDHSWHPSKLTNLVRKSLYAAPNGKLVSGSIAPQELTILDEVAGWYKIGSYAGEVWILGDNMTTETVDVASTKMTVDGSYGMYTSPKDISPFDTGKDLTFTAIRHLKGTEWYFAIVSGKDFWFKKNEQTYAGDTFPLFVTERVQLHDAINGNPLSNLYFQNQGIQAVQRNGNWFSYINGGVERWINVKYPIVGPITNVNKYVTFQSSFRSYDVPNTTSPNYTNFGAQTVTITKEWRDWVYINTANANKWVKKP